MKIKNVIITHHGGYKPAPERCYFVRFWANATGNLRAQLLCEIRDENRRRQTSVKKLLEYDFSNLIENINYKQQIHNYVNIIENVILIGDTIHVDVHDIQDGFSEIHLLNLTNDYKQVDIISDQDVLTKVTDNVIFPLAETHNEWIDRMERLLAFCAHNFENAIGQLYPQHYTRLHDVATALPSTDFLNRLTNTSVHCRLAIGWLWERVNRIKRKLPTTFTKAGIEANIQALYQNLKDVQNIKLFFHKHNVVDWNKLRNHGVDKDTNKRQIQLWDSDYTAGILLADINARNTLNNVLHDTNAEASMFTLGTTEYRKAASHLNWEPITERIY